MVAKIRKYLKMVLEKTVSEKIEEKAEFVAKELNEIIDMDSSDLAQRLSVRWETAIFLQAVLKYQGIKGGDEKDG